MRMRYLLVIRFQLCALIRKRVSAEDARKVAPRQKSVLCGSTLAETLVTMLVAGTLFLAVMEGLTLFMRLQTRRAETLIVNGRQRDGFGRIERLAASVDSLATDDAKAIVCAGSSLSLWCNGRLYRLSLCDSVLLVSCEAYRDTLLRNAGRLRLLQGKRGKEILADDTIEIGLLKRVLKFPVRRAVEERYEMAIARIENDYGYE